MPKWEKYRNKYLRLKRANMVYIDDHLFFDLYKIMLDIYSMSPADPIVILIGEGPSYLEPLLGEDVAAYQLPFREDIYNCFEQNKISNLSVNEQDEAEYFRYLESETDLKRDYLIENWLKIILVDNSQIRVHQVALCLNRYVGNVVGNRCQDVKGIKPLKHIKLTPDESPNTNLPPDIYLENSLDLPASNYNPDFIILLGVSRYANKALFDENRYASVVPKYINGEFVRGEEDDTDHEQAEKNMVTMKRMLKSYENLQNKKDSIDQELRKNMLKRYVYVLAQKGGIESEELALLRDMLKY